MVHRLFSVCAVIFASMCWNLCKSCMRTCKTGAVNLVFTTRPRRLYLYCLTSWSSLSPRPQVTPCKSLISLEHGINYRYSTDARTAATSGNAVQTDTTDEPVIVGPSDQLLQSLTENDQHKMKVLWMELEVFRQQGLPVPYQMSDQHWKEAAEMTSRSQRLKLYRFLCIRNARRERGKQKKAERREAIASQQPLELVRNKELSTDSHLQYGLNQNTIFLRLRESSINFVYNHWQCQGLMFGQKLVVDLGYDEHMVKRECSNCAEQIKDMYAFNKMNRQPFNLYLCNANPRDNTLQHLEQFIPNLYSYNCLMTVTEKSYLELFPKENIIYLTPHCKQELFDYDRDAIYIVGGIVDKTTPHPISLAKAKKEGVRVARLPLDHYLDWGTGGNKSLTLDQIMKILLDIKNTGDWSKALKHVPKRKLRKEELYQSPKTKFFLKHSRHRSLFED